jgi:bifunctional non-homologous end joining protein LigD
VTSGVRGPSSDDIHEIDIGGRVVRVTHLHRILWPQTGTTKADLIDYLVAVAPALIRHLQARATMLWRFPEGVDGPGWFQAQCRGRPPWVPVHELIGRRGDALRYCVIEEPATLVWLANLGTIEFHPHNWTIDRPTRPSAIVFDLDPGPSAGLAETASVALRVADELRRAEMTPFVKTSGSRGLHVAAPVGADATFEQIKAMSRDIAERLARDTPDRVVASSERGSRNDRVFIDWVQNDRNRQLIAPYSPRATPVPRVSTPLRWEEVERMAAGERPESRYPFRDALERLATDGDLWLPGLPPD